MLILKHRIYYINMFYRGLKRCERRGGRRKGGESWGCLTKKGAWLTRNELRVLDRTNMQAGEMKKVVWTLLNIEIHPGLLRLLPKNTSC